MDKRRDEGEYYPYGKRVLPSVGDGDVKHAEFEGIEEIPRKFTDEDVRSKVNTIVRVLKGATAALAAFLALNVFGAGVDVLSAPKGAVYNDEPVVTNVTFDASGLATTGEAASLRFDVESNRVEIASLKDTAQTLSDTVSTLSDAVSTNAANVSTLSDTQAAHSAEIAALAAATNDLRGKLDMTVYNEGWDFSELEATYPGVYTVGTINGTVTLYVDGAYKACPARLYYCNNKSFGQLGEIDDGVWQVYAAPVGTNLAGKKAYYRPGTAFPTADRLATTNQVGSAVAAATNALKRAVAAQIAQIAADNERYVAMFILDTGSWGSSWVNNFELKASESNFGTVDFAARGACASTGADAPYVMDRMRLFVPGGGGEGDASRALVPIATTLEVDGGMTRYIVAVVDVTCLRRNPGFWLRESNDNITWSVFHDGDGWWPVQPTRWFKSTPSWAQQ